LLALLVLTLLPRVGACLANLASGRPGELPGTSHHFLLVITVGVYLIVAVVMSSNNHLLGDGYTLLDNLQESIWFSPTEPLDYLWHHAIYAVLPDGDQGALWSYRLASYLAGIMFLLVLWVAYRRSLPWSTAVAATTGFAVTQFFFGYVESYTCAFLFAFAYLASGHQDLLQGRVRWQTWLLLASAVGFHLSSLVLLPSLVYLVSQCYRSRAAVLLTAAAAAGILAAGIAFAGSKVEFGQIIVPFAPTEHNPYSLGAGQHVSDMVNIVMLNLPLLPVIVLCLISRQRPAWGWFYLLALTPALLFMLFVDPKIGAMRDWDLLALAAAPALAALLAILASWSELDSLAVRALAAPLLIFGVIHTGSWIVANASAAESYSYLKAVVAEDVHYSEDYYQAYRCKSWGTLAAAAFQDFDEATRAAKVRFRADPSDQKNRYNLAMHYFFHADELKHAAVLLSNNWWQLTGDEQKVLNIAGVFRQAGRDLEEGRVLASFIDRGGSNHLVFFNYARWLTRRGKFDQAVTSYERALASWPNAPADVRLEFCLVLLQQGTADRALTCLAEVAPSLNQEQQRLIQAINTASATGNRARVDSLVLELLLQL
jgi:tetratricopeptide (TPR) repeat protein